MVGSYNQVLRFPYYQVHKKEGLVHLQYPCNLKILAYLASNYLILSIQDTSHICGSPLQGLQLTSPRKPSRSILFMGSVQLDQAVSRCPSPQHSSHVTAVNSIKLQVELEPCRSQHVPPAEIQRKSFISVLHLMQYGKNNETKKCKTIDLPVLCTNSFQLTEKQIWIWLTVLYQNIGTQ